MPIIIHCYANIQFISSIQPFIDIRRKFNSLLILWCPEFYSQAGLLRQYEVIMFGVQVLLVCIIKIALSTLVLFFPPIPQTYFCVLPTDDEARIFSNHLMPRLRIKLMGRLLEGHLRMLNQLGYTAAATTPVLLILRVSGAQLPEPGGPCERHQPIIFS